MLLSPSGSPQDGDSEWLVKGERWLKCAQVCAAIYVLLESSHRLRVAACCHQVGVLANQVSTWAVGEGGWSAHT